MAVQKISTFRNEVSPRGPRRPDRRAPGVPAPHRAGRGVALLTDTVGFITMLVIKIEIIRELAIIASLGVSVIVVTNFVLLPILLSYPPRLPASLRPVGRRAPCHDGPLLAARRRMR